LRIPDAQTLLLTAKGVGVQIYKSQLKSGSTTEFEWVLKEPRANLYDNSRKKIGKHYAGPTWESKDGSKVVGKLKQSVPAPKADNIPWLLVEAQSHEGKGIFSEVSYILRVDTVVRFKVALEALKGLKTVAELASIYGGERGSE
jgi:Protein of unknown function (DUF3455)